MSKYTDEQIREEVNKTLANPLLRQCGHCAHGQDYTTCDVLHIPISRYQYCGHCRHYLTNEERLIQEAKEAMARQDRESKKDDRVLTMSFISVEMSMVYLEHFKARIEAEYNKALKRIEAKYAKIKQGMTEEDKEYLADKRKEYKKLANYIESLQNALKKMNFHFKEAEKQFTHMVEPKLNVAFFDENRTAFKVDEYDNHNLDVNELCEVNMAYFDATYLNEDNSRIIKNCIYSVPAERMMEKEDYRRYQKK